VSAAVCTRCDAKLRTPDTRRLCGLCIAEARHLAVSTFVQNQGEGDDAKRRRANAMFTLRDLGHSKAESLHARARAFDGHSVEEILEGLCGDGAKEAVAA
jgi:hypothetical protein